ncbi:MAG TPA: undecaprenyl-phosphate glucose phosphotransferase [Chitinophagaceae bacterium]|nr:undecaprenyl-phosphate glucose phosphotransferase [Chitinophagaceae bacterium]
MKSINNLSTRVKIIADLVIIALIVALVQNWLIVNEGHFLTNSKLAIVLASLATWFFCARVFGLYEDFREIPFSQEWIVFCKTFVLYSLLISFVFFAFLIKHPFSRSHIVMHCSLMFVTLPVQKLAIRILFKRIRSHQNIIRKVLIVGAGINGIEFYQQYVKNENYGYKLTGFIDDTRNASLNGYYLGRASEIDKILARHELDDIVVTMPTEEEVLQKIVTVGEKQGKRIRIIPDYQQYGPRKLQVDSLGNLQIITLGALPLDIIDNRILKRCFDILFSILIITLVFSWLFPIIAIIIKISSKGPVFFKQERWGMNNRSIICYKFRSMVCTSRDVDDNGIYQQARKNDPRFTPIGAFLRKTNLDELPQFINVLMGSMSVVGPRPHPVPLNLMSKDMIENYMRRHMVKPGITGWAQVNGHRGETRDPEMMQKRVESDLWYIENWTFWLDQQIIVQTLVNMVKGEKNAF